MARYIKIRKIKERDLQYYYEVIEDTEHFYMLIDAKAKKLLFFLDNNFSKKSEYEIDLNNPDQKINPSKINIKTLVAVMIKAMKAIERNEFLDHLDYTA